MREHIFLHSEVAVAKIWICSSSEYRATSTKHRCFDTKAASVWANCRLSSARRRHICLSLYSLIILNCVFCPISQGWVISVINAQTRVCCISGCTRTPEIVQKWAREKVFLSCMGRKPVECTHTACKYGQYIETHETHYTTIDKDVMTRNWVRTMVY